MCGCCHVPSSYLGLGRDNMFLKKFTIGELREHSHTHLHTHLQLESFEKLIVLLLCLAFSRLGNRIWLLDLLTRIIQQRIRIIIIIIIIISSSSSSSCSSSWRWQRIKTHIHWIKEVKPLSCWVWVYRQLGAVNGRVGS